MKKILLLLFFISLKISAQGKIEIFFDFDKYDLNDAAVETLDNAIANRQNIEVSKIYGFCDWKGSNSYNDTLSLKRVDEVWHFLKNKGIRIRDDYEKRGFGEDFEQSKVQSENRKVMVVFEEVKAEKPIRNDDNRILSEKVKTAKRGDKIKLQNINFHNNSAVIVAKSKPVLYDLLCVMEDNPKLKIEIQGHICCQPERDVNDVSTARARAIYMFLIRNKIDRKRLSFKGFGISDPIYPIPEKSEAEADENRRVEIMIVEN
ncbi:MAG TPA: OmpA family protein [Flavobacterium sp.]|nr:OmpA family protein [Flavobacterium sp.]